MHIGKPDRNQRFVFWGCFVALITSAFGFAVRAQIIGEWGREFGLSATQQGEIFGVGLWPFAISIVLMSMVVDRLGYGRSLVIALILHVVSTILTILAKGYWGLYIGTFLFALANGTVEAVINPVVATMYAKEKSKWLNILHAGWPGGIMLGGILAIAMGPVDWRWKIGLIFLPTVVYAVLCFRRTFPVNERVAAGVPYRAMLEEFGVLGAFLVVFLMIREVGRVFAFSDLVQGALIAVLVGSFAFYVRSWGRPLFIFLLLIMLPLATTEIGTDSWITQLMEPAMEGLGIYAGWVLVYTAFIMTVLRFLAGPIVHFFQPLGLLAVSSVLAAIGLVALSQVQAGLAVLFAATVYGVGKTFFWPTMLGVVAEQCPRGGALTLNSIGGVGMLGVGVVGVVFLGNIQDKTVERELLAHQPEIHAKVVGEATLSVLGSYRPVDLSRIERLEPAQKSIADGIVAQARQHALATVAVFPAIMLVCYCILIVYFRRQGGYVAQRL